MQAVFYRETGGPEVIEIREVPESLPGSDDVLVAVAYAGLNRADILERAGRYGPAARDPNAIPGLEFSGTVVAAGSNVRNLAPGTRVCGLVVTGAHAERLVTNALTLAPVPDALDLQTAASIPEAFLTAYDALFAVASMALGDTVLVHAAGSGVGLAAVALAKRAGAFVIGTSRTAEKLRRASELGLDAAVEIGEDWPESVMAATGGRGVDVVLDFLGAGALDRNVAVLKTGGRIVQIGTLAGARAQLDLGPFMAKRATLAATVMRTRRLAEKIVLARALGERILPQVARGELRLPIDRVFPLAEMAAAHRYLESDRNFGKVLIDLAP
jgi:putative PIG3 family NAD(P)H quinone oxidoreductase